MIQSDNRLILLVEDEPVLAMTEKITLEQYGYRVITANSGEKSIRVFSENPDVSLILMDIDLGPGMDGTEAAMNILSQRDIPVVFLSSHTDTSMVERTEKITSYGYVVKNTGITVLDASIKMAYRLFEEKSNVKLKQQEISAANEKLEETIHKLENAYNELAATNEEMESTNEELASTIEELEATNEELAATNELLEQSQREIFENNEKLEALFDMLPVAISVIDKNGKIVRQNSKLSEVMEMSRNGLSQGKYFSRKYIKPDGSEFPASEFPSARILRGEKSVTDAELGIIKESGETTWVNVNAVSCPFPDWSVIVATQDITERKRADEEVYSMAAKLEAAMSSMADAVFITNLEGEFIHFNDAFATIHKFRNRDECARTLAEYPEFLDVFMDTGELAPLEMWAVPRALRGETVMNAEYSLRRKDTGDEWIGSYSFGPIRDKDGTIVGSVVVGRDITEQKNAEARIRESEREFRLLAEAMPQIVWATDADGKNIYFNRRWVDYTGMALEESYGDGWNRPFHPDDQQRSWIAWQDATQHGTEYSVECRIRRFDGEYRWWLIRGVPIYDNNGNIYKWFGTCTDINEIKEKEARLQESERRFSKLFHVSPACQVITTYPEGIIVDINEAFCRVLGYEREHLIGRKTIDAGFWPDQTDRILAFNEFRENGKIHGREMFIRNSSGELRTLLASVESLEFDGEDCAVSTAIDITDRINLLDRLHNSEADLAEAQRLTKIGNWGFNVATGAVRWSDELYTVFDVDKGEFSGMYDSFIQNVHPEDRPAVKKTNSNAIASGEPFDLEYRIVNRKGELKYIREVGYAKKDSEGNVISLFGTAQDITERKLAEVSIRDSERFLSSTLDSLTANIAIVDSEGTIVKVNRSWQRFAEENTPGTPFDYNGVNYLSVCDAATGDDADLSRAFADGIRKVMKGELNEYSVEYPCHSPAEERWFAARVVPFIGEGPVYAVISHENITERKKSEVSLRESEERYRTMVESTTDAIFINRDGRVVYVNDACVNLYRADEPSQIIGKSPFELIHPDSHELVSERIRLLLSGFEPAPPAEVKMLRFDGTTVDVESTAIPYNAGGADAIQVIIRDVSFRKDAERALRQWGDAFNHCAHGIALGDPVTGTIMICNPAFAKLLSTTVEDVTGSPILSLYAEQERHVVLEHIMESDRTGEIRYETYMLRRDGTTFPVQLDLVSVKDRDGRVIYRVATIQDISARREAEEALALSETRYRIIFEGAEQGIIAADAETMEFLFVNPAICKLFGYTKEEFLMLNIRDLHPAVMADEIIGKFGMLARSEVSSVADIPCVCKNGRVFYVDISASFTILDGRKSLIAFFTDITERLNSRRVLLESEERFRNLIENSHDLIQSVNSEGHFIFVNRKWIETMEYSHEEIRTLNLFDVIHPDSMVVCREEFRQVMQGTPLHRISPVFVTKSGRVLSMEGSVVSQLLADGTMSTNAFFEDVTERRRAEMIKSLRLAVSSIISMSLEIDTTSELIVNSLCIESGWSCGELWRPHSVENKFIRTYSWVKNNDEKLSSFINQSADLSFAKGKGLPGTAWMKRKTIWSGTLYEDPEFQRKELARESGLKSAVAIPLVDKDFVYGVMLFFGSSERSMESDLLSAFDELGRQIGMYITRKILEAELEIERHTLAQRVEERTAKLREAMTLAESANRAKSDFLANMSHELRTPLNSIIGFSEIMIDGMVGDMNPEQKEFLSDIHESGNHLLSLINDILDLSKVESGRMELELSSVNVKTVIKSTYSLFRERSMKHNITIDAETKSGVDDLLIQADERKLKQVLFNLVSNAIKFTPDGGRVIISAELKEKNGKHHVEFMVSDTGIGIPEEYHEKVFEPFYQVDNSITRSFSGTGLGLPISRSFVELHGGELWYDSSREKGSRFFFTIPVRRDFGN